MAKHKAGHVVASSSAYQGKVPFSSLLYKIANHLPPTERVVPKRLKAKGSWASSNRKMTNEQVREARAKYQAGTHSIRMLTSEYGVHEMTMRAILRGETRPFA